MLSTLLAPFLRALQGLFESQRRHIVSIMSESGKCSLLILLKFALFTSMPSSHWSHKHGIQPEDRVFHPLSLTCHTIYQTSLCASPCHHACHGKASGGLLTQDIDEGIAYSDLRHSSLPPYLSELHLQDDWHLSEASFSFPLRPPNLARLDQSVVRYRSRFNGLFTSTVLPKRMQNSASSCDSKALLSPFNFQAPTQYISATPNYECSGDDDVERLHSASSVKARDACSSYEWSPPAPHRQLLYGGPATSSKNALLPGPSSSRQSNSEEKCIKWIDEMARIKTNRPYNSEPSRQRPRLWLDLVEDDDEIEEAVSLVNLFVALAYSKILACHKNDTQSLKASHDFDFTPSSNYISSATDA